MKEDKLAKKESTEFATVPDYLKDENENLGGELANPSEDMLVPRIKLVQGLTEEHTSLKIPEGHWVNSITKEDYGEEIMVWDDGEERTYRKFVGFLYGRKSPYRTESFLDPKDCISWQHARPITKPDIKITVEINGELKSLSEISEETLLNIRKESK